jgi:hypothetical protein
VLNANWAPYTAYSIVWKEPKPYDLLNPTIPTRARRMFYYGLWGTGATSYTDLLKDGDGQCGAWVSFWMSEIRVQGIMEVTPTIITILPPEDSNGFLVKNWTFADQGTSGDPSFPYKATFTGGTPARSSMNNNLEGNHYEFTQSDLTDLPGVPGQGSGAYGTPNGNANPVADFNIHHVVGLNGRIYDPSYGKDFATIAAWEDASIAAFYKQVSGAQWNVKLNTPNVKKVKTIPAGTP